MGLSGVFVIEIVLALAVDVLGPFKAGHLADVAVSQALNVAVRVHNQPPPLPDNLNIFLRHRVFLRRIRAYNTYKQSCFECLKGRLAGIALLYSIRHGAIRVVALEGITAGLAAVRMWRFGLGRRYLLALGWLVGFGLGYKEGFWKETHSISFLNAR
jgi:hypothetical protein